MNKTTIVRPAALVALSCYLVVSQIALAETIRGRVVSVADGDTLTILDATKVQHKIRLAGIDAPEKKQAYGQRSKASLAKLAFNREAVADCDKTDKYARKVCKVFVDEVDINLEQLNQGLAWWYQKYAHEQPREDQQIYSHAETSAMMANRGLWADREPTPPWEFRRDSKGGYPSPRDPVTGKNDPVSGSSLSGREQSPERSTANSLPTSTSAPALPTTSHAETRTNRNVGDGCNGPLHTGPRGGKYYLSSTGRKVYCP